MHFIFHKVVAADVLFLSCLGELSADNEQKLYAVRMQQRCTCESAEKQNQNKRFEMTQQLSAVTKAKVVNVGIPRH